MKVKRNVFYYNLCLIIIFIIFWGLFDDAVSFILLFVFSILFAFQSNIGKLAFSHKLYLLIPAIICIFIGFRITQYSQFYSVTSFGVLISLYLLLDNGFNANDVYNRNFDWFCITMWLMILYNIFLNVQAGNTEINFESINDKNYTSCFVYMMFLYSHKRNFVPGILFSLGFTLFLSRSRSLWLLMIGFYIVKYMRPIIYTSLKKLKLNNDIFIIFIILFVFITIFSYIWVYDISNLYVHEYRTSLNDGSNRMRFVSTIKALELLKEDKRFLFCGYGNDIFDALGIENYAFYLNVRLVQPHNSLINPLLRMGIIPGTIYLFLTAKLLNRFYYEDNLEYILPYTLNAMFMHSFFNLQWFIFWVLILMLPNKKTEVKISFKNGKLIKNSLTGNI